MSRHTFGRESADLQDLMGAGRHLNKQEIQPLAVEKTDAICSNPSVFPTARISGTPLAYPPFVPTLGVPQ